jgi:hypothetical protein
VHIHFLNIVLPPIARALGVFSELWISRRGETVSMFDEDGKPLWEIVAERRFEGG